MGGLQGELCAGSELVSRLEAKQRPEAEYVSYDIVLPGSTQSSWCDIASSERAMPAAIVVSPDDRGGHASPTVRRVRDGFAFGRPRRFGGSSLRKALPSLWIGVYQRLSLPEKIDCGAFWWVGCQEHCQEWA
jgi:hypothetical protein